MKESKHIQLNKSKWDKWAETVDGKGRLYDYLRKAQSSLVALLDIKEGINFLDIGCGTGWALDKVSGLTGNRGSFFGVDLSEKMIEKAKENFKDHDNFHFLTANVESVPLDDNLFDIIICTHSFHHYLHPDKAMNEICRLLKPGGKIYILDITADLWLVKISSKLSKLFSPAHVTFYSTKEFKKLIIKAGLKYSGCERIKAYQKVHIGEK
jgi:ubiquinone/menaquinone biosynthesis C-methylase UbiE